MSAPESNLDICNLAFDLLRQNEQVSDLDTPGSELEALSARWYDATRRAVLGMFAWNFAKSRAVINRSGTPAFEYPDEYQLPNDYLGIIFIGDDKDAETPDFEIEGGKLLIDNDGGASLQICYIKDIEDVTKFTPLFVMLLASELAMVFGNAIAGLNRSLAGIEKIRDRWETKARTKNGHENPITVKYKSPLLTARRSSTRLTSSDGVHLFST